MKIVLLTILLGLVGCSTVKNMAIKSVTPIFVDGANQLNTERNWPFFRDAMPANLKLYEILYLQDKENLGLLATLVKGYAGYAFGIAETLAYGDELAGYDDSVHKKNAIALYTKTLDYGLEYLQQLGIQRIDLLGLDEGKLTSLLENKLSKSDHMALLYFAQAWGSLINLQKDNIALISHVPKVKVLFDWVCHKNANIENGVCDLYYGQYEASRPLMLGGNPAKAVQIFQAGIKKRPLNLLVRVAYLQYSVLPTFDRTAYENEAQVLRQEFLKWEDINRDTLDDKSEYKAVEHLNLFNAIAQKRFEFMEKNKNKILEGSNQ